MPLLLPQKAVTPAWYQIFIRGIGANWLVCLACLLASCAREFFSKVVAIWWPVFAFVLLGFDHVVANMFYIPLAIFLHHPKISVGYYIWKSMIPAGLGNIVGGGLFVAIIYWYLFLVGQGGPVTIDGENFEIMSQPLTNENDLEAGRKRDGGVVVTSAYGDSSGIESINLPNGHHDHKGDYKGPHYE